MKKKTKTKILIVLLILMGLHFITYSIDSKRVSESRKPIFVIISLPFIKDGGSAIYYGIGYQVIKWHKQGDVNLDERFLGFEINRIPFFKSYEDGPDPNIKYVDYYIFRKIRKK
ncbi:MAG: hypothetical protein ACREV6_06770 [Clostridium sp.]|uniref:hypothetical protein n=1 Tax=Clostridium sp. TaxID=1506 RepID=UPI003D6D679D